MKKLQCEMCGGDLIKRDGMFQCESCGCKYTKEEAQKLFMNVSGDVNISGGATINMSESAETLIERANSFVNLGEFGKAHSEYKHVTEKFPADYRGWYGMAMCYAEIASLGLLGHPGKGGIPYSYEQLSEFNTLCSHAFACTQDDAVARANLEELMSNLAQAFCDNVYKHGFWYGLASVNEAETGVYSHSIYSMRSNGVIRSPYLASRSPLKEALAAAADFNALLSEGYPLAFNTAFKEVCKVNYVDSIQSFTLVSSVSFHSVTPVGVILALSAPAPSAPLFFPSTAAQVKSTLVKSMLKAGRTPESPYEP